MLHEDSEAGRLLFKKWQYYRNLGLRDIENIKDKDQLDYDLEFPNGNDAWSLNKFEIKSREGKQLDIRNINPLYD